MSTRSRSRQAKPGEFTIEFHAVASKAFLTEPISKRVGIRFNLEEKGGWTCVYFCEISRYVNDFDFF